jgi:hypothetical protein
VVKGDFALCEPRPFEHGLVVGADGFRSGIGRGLIPGVGVPSPSKAMMAIA